MTPISNRRFLISLCLSLGLGLSLNSVMPTLAQAEDKKGAAADPLLTLLPIPIPISKDNKIVNYIFINMKVHLNPKAEVSKLGGKEPYLRDCILHMAAKISFAKPDRDDLLDEPRFTSAVLHAFEPILGQGQVVSIEIVSAKAKYNRG